MSGISRCGITLSLPRMALAALLSASATGASAAEPAAAADTFDMICKTTADHVEGTLADGSPVVAGTIGEVRRYSFDLAGMRYATDGKVKAIHAVDGDVLVKADPDEIRSFGGVVHMQSDWRLDLRNGRSVRKNRFYGDATGTRVTGRSEWHQQCERAPYSGMQAG